MHMRQAMHLQASASMTSEVKVAYRSTRHNHKWQISQVGTLVTLKFDC